MPLRPNYNRTGAHHVCLPSLAKTKLKVLTGEIKMYKAWSKVQLREYTKNSAMTLGTGQFSQEKAGPGMTG